jgi:hypothetical protein
MGNELDPEELVSMRKTLDACAWLFPVAERSVADFGWDPVVLRWLDSLGSGLQAELGELQ